MFYFGVDLPKNRFL